jgi:MFS family permease
MILRLLSGAVGLTILVFTVLLARVLSPTEHDAGMLLAGYIGVGCVMFGVYFLFYALTGDWLPKLSNSDGRVRGKYRRR